MALSAFSDKQHPPGEDALRGVLDDAHAPWMRLIELVGHRVDSLSTAWGFTSASTGWGLRLKRGDRILVYMTPGQGRFLVSFALGEKAVAAAHVAGPPATVLQAIEDAPRYAEGRGVRFEVRRMCDVAPLAVLAQVKDAH
jgi:hypothetical protein